MKSPLPGGAHCRARALEASRRLSVPGILAAPIFERNQAFEAHGDTFLPRTGSDRTTTPDAAGMGSRGLLRKREYRWPQGAEEAVSGGLSGDR
jgi:hypothetical protein